MVRVRIAPSPTGDPHVGTAYIALFNYVWARKHGGQFVLRIEDTDRARSKPEWEQMVLESLRWVGLRWDEGPDIGGEHGPYRQSERGAIYAEHAERLLQSGAAYRCFCSAERLAEVREQQRARKETPRYDGHCRALANADIEANLEAGVPHVVRLRTPDGGVTRFADRLRGEVEIANEQIDDQVLLKSDGMPTYHLANVVDDHLMGITHVIRAEEWVTSTPKHVLLYAAFGWGLPEFVHLPLLRNADKSKISKRKNPVSINYYRDAGYLPEALRNYLGMMGWTMPDEREKFTLDEMVDNFTFERVSLGGPVFDVPKLTWLNGLYLRELSPAQFLDRLRNEVLSSQRLEEIVPLIQPRVEKLEDFVAQSAFFFVGDVDYDAAARAALVPKKREPKEMAAALEVVLTHIDAMPVLAREPVEQMLRGLCEELQMKPKELFMPVRIAVTGRKATPGLFETMEVLGKERCRRRLRAAIELLRQQ